MNKQQFYLIWSPQGETPSVVKFDTYAVCSKICYDMAKRHAGQDFYLMKAKAHYAVGKVKKTNLVRNEHEYTIPSVAVDETVLIEDLETPATKPFLTEVIHIVPIKPAITVISEHDLLNHLFKGECTDADCWCNNPVFAQAVAHH